MIEEASIHDEDGWSKYQLLVLQQLEDHNIVLQNFNKEIISINKTIAVHEAELKMWKSRMVSDVEKLETSIEEILCDEQCVDQRLSLIEKNVHAEEQVEIQSKYRLTLYISILTVVLNVIIQAAGIYLKIK